MKRRLLFLLCSGLISLNVLAEDDTPPTYGTITGSVVDALSKDPIPYANVVVRDDSDSLITGGITDANGEFRIKDIPEGNNTVEIQFIGYETVSAKVDVNRENSMHNLRTISLNESMLELDEVVIRGELSTVTQKIDRKVINVGKDLTATGTNASELLNNVQSVSVDQQTGEISLRGNENVKILVDGRPTNVSAAQLLQQIPSSSIKSIELITNPSAKYNPEGMSGIINIVLYSSATLGLNGNVNGGLTYGKNLDYNGSLDVNYRKGKVNVYLNYGGNLRNWEGSGEVYRTDNKSVQLNTSEGQYASHLVKVGADLYLNESNTLSLFTTQNLQDGLNMRNDMVYFEDILDSDNRRTLDSEEHTGTYNLNYRRDFSKKDHMLEFNASYSHTGEFEAGNYVQVLQPDDPTSNYMEEIEDGITTTILNLDYTNPVTENIQLELGLETRLRRADNLYLTDRHAFVYNQDNMLIPDGNGWFETAPMGDSEFSYNRSIYSAYANYGHQLGRLAMQLGVRLEQYDVEAAFAENEQTDSYEDHRFTAYPSAFFTYGLNDRNQVQVSYSRRVDRPGIGQVNPIRTSWSSPLLIFKGNPELEPQFTNSVELNYSRRLKKGSASAGVFYRRVSDNIIRYSELDPLDPDKVILSYVNSDGEDRYGIEMSGRYRPAKWWSMNASFDVYYRLMSGYAFNQYVEVSSYATNLRINNTFPVTENLSFQLFGMYRGKRQTIQWDMPPMWMANAGVSYKVFNRKGTITFRVNDIFKTMRFRYESTNFLPSNGAFYWESRTAYLGYSHHFGQGKNRARRINQPDDRELEGGEGF